MTSNEAFPLPIEIDAIDAAWITAALRRKAPEATVTRCDIVEVARGTCTRIRLRLECDDAAKAAGIPDEVILKGGFEPHSRALCDMHAAEALGYRDVMPATRFNSPACYFADYDADRGQGIVIMEDLRRRGVRFGDALRPQAYEEVARQLTMLAELHAQTWDSAIFRAGGEWSWISDTMSVIDSYFKPILQGPEWLRYSSLPRAAAASVRFSDPEWLMASMYKLCTLAERRTHCVLHGDTHQGNLYIEADGSPGFFDTIPHFGPAMWEATYHIVCALDPVDRRQWDGALVAHYLDELRRFGVISSDLNLDVAMADYALWLTRAYLIFLINDPLFQQEPVNTGYVARIGVAMLEHDTLGAFERFT